MGSGLSDMAGLRGGRGKVPQSTRPSPAQRLRQQCPTVWENHRRLGWLSLGGRWRTLQRAEHTFRIASDRQQVGAGRLVGAGAALFPVAQRPEGNLIAGRKLLLCETEGTPQRFR